MVKCGYKQTEIGVIPEDWKIDCIQNAHLKARIGWQGLTTNEYLNEGDYYLVTGTDFKESRIDWSNCHNIEKIRYEQDKNIQVKKHDILVTKDGTIGKVAYIDFCPKPATLNSGIFVIRPKKVKFVPHFLYYVLLGSGFKKFMDDLTAGSTIVHLYQKDFINFKFQFPPLEEQKKIAEVLSDIDNLITSIEKLVVKKKAIKQGITKNLLTGKKRIEGNWIVSKNYKQTEIGIVPEDWKISIVDSLMNVTTGSRNTENKNDKGVYPFFVRSDKVEKIDSYKYDCEAVLTAGDGVGTGKVFHYIDSKFDAHQRVYIMYKFNNIEGKFFYYYFKENFFNEVSKYTAKSSVDSVRRDMITKMLILVPPIDEQKEIINILSDIDIEIYKLTNKLVKYRQLKRGMMHDLLTGKIRIT